MSSLPLAELGHAGGFQSDRRFDPGPAQPLDPGDPLALAWQDGHAAGLAEARAEAQALAETEAAARARIELSLVRLDAELGEALRQRLVDTVAALCEATLAPLAMDRAALLRRVEIAAAMLARADDDKVLRLHPDDLALVARQLPQDLEVSEDPALERGALRIETQAGGVEDGPAHWRRAIAEALAQC
ncbi:MAG: FliH/SctL family protein [Novosphingobium sp.]